MKPTIKHSLVVPCFNEAENIEAFFAAVETAMQGYTDAYEIVFINDGSSDSTQAKLDGLYEQHRDRYIQIIRFSRNFGKEAAMLAGLRAAKGEYVTIIDADLQQRPEIAVEMGKLLDGQPDVDMVAAFQQERKESKLIEACKELFYKLLNRMSEVDIIPDASDFRTLRRPVVQTVLSLSEYHRFSKGIFSWIGYTTVSIPYEPDDRLAGQSKWNFWKLLRYAVGGIVAYTDFPLKLPVIFGCALLIIAAVTTIILLILSLLGHEIAGAWWVSCLVSAVSSALAFGQGVLGLYLGKVHTQVKQRPVYIVKEKRSYEQD